MAEAAVLPSALTAYTNEDYNEEPFAFFTGGMSTPEDLSGASARMGISAPGLATVQWSTGSGQLTITQPNIVSITVPIVQMAVLPGLYRFDLVITYGSGDAETVLTGQLRVVQGIAT